VIQLFFFTVKKSSINANGQIVFEFQRKPRSSMDLSEYSSGMTSDKVISNFKNWVSIIEGYSHISLTDEDSFEKRYQEEFINDFELVDADADENPFSVSQQIYINEYVKIIQSVLEANKDKYQVQELIEEAQIIREQLPASTKSKVVNSISKLLAKIQMKGLELLKEVWSEAKKQAIKKIIEGSLENLPKLLDIFS